MLDIKFIRENVSRVEAGLKAKRVNVDLSQLLSLDAQRRQITTQIDDLKSQKNVANEEIGRLIKEKQDAKAKIASMKSIAVSIDEFEPKLKELDAQMHEILLTLPNLPHESVPVGSPELNQEVSTWGNKPTFSFKPKTHIEIAESLDIIDFKRGTKLNGRPDLYTK